MEAVPLATLNTDSCGLSPDERWILERVFGPPTCSQVAQWAASPALWAIAVIFLLLVLFVPLFFLGFNREGMVLYIVVVLILFFLLMWWFGNSVVNQWQRPHCQV
jgi:hypothetical protein